MDIFEILARPRRQPKMLNSTFSRAKSDYTRDALLQWLSEQEADGLTSENEKLAGKVAAKAKR